jgi:hypothetical protein
VEESRENYRHPLIMAYLVKGENCKSIFQLVKGKYIKPTHSQQTSIHTKAQSTAITERYAIIKGSKIKVLSSTIFNLPWLQPLKNQ